MPAKRRSRGEGSIHKRPDGTYRGYLTLPPEIVGGKKKQRRRYVSGETRPDVRIALDRLRLELAQGGVVRSRANATTIATYLADWITGLEVRDATRRQYTWIVNAYLTPRLGAFRLEDLAFEDVTRFLASLRKDKIGDRTQQLCHNVLRIALKRAVRAKILRANPMEGTPAPRNEGREMTPWTREQAAAVIAAARNDRFAAAYVLALRLGLQFPGEVLGLRWSDVDLRAGEMYLSSQLLSRGRVRAPTKTEARRRRLVLPAAVIAALTVQRERLLAEGLRASPWVFPNQHGDAMNARNFVRDSFDPVVARAGVPRVRPYDMRHTFATLALIAGVHVKIVSEMLGHASIDQTLKTYSHYLPTMQNDAVRVMDAYWDEASTNARS